MAGERSMEPAIEVVLLAPAVIAQPEVNDSVSVESTGLSQPASARLIAGLRDQGIEPGPVTSITDPDPASQRAQLVAVLAGPDSADPDRDPLPPIALLAADVVVNATPLGAVLDDPRVRTGALAARVGASIDPEGRITDWAWATPEGTEAIGATAAAAVSRVAIRRRFMVLPLG